MNFMAKCDNQCAVCYTISESSSGVKQKASVTVKSDQNGMADVQIQLKNASKLPRDFGKIISRLSD